MPSRYTSCAKRCSGPTATTTIISTARPSAKAPRGPITSLPARPTWPTASGRSTDPVSRLTLTAWLLVDPKTHPASPLRIHSSRARQGTKPKTATPHPTARRPHQSQSSKQLRNPRTGRLPSLLPCWASACGGSLVAGFFLAFPRRRLGTSAPRRRANAAEQREVAPDLSSLRGGAEASGRAD